MFLSGCLVWLFVFFRLVFRFSSTFVCFSAKGILALRRENVLQICKPGEVFPEEFESCFSSIQTRCIYSAFRLLGVVHYVVQKSTNNCISESVLRQMTVFLEFSVTSVKGKLEEVTHLKCTQCKTIQTCLESK